MSRPSREEIEQMFRARQRMLWGLCYRLTGVAADADELVQETFVRAIERPPAVRDENWHRWLVRVATRLSLDRLRARRRAAYTGSWLPSPLETVGGIACEDAAAGYELREGLSYAFLVALETLTPRARAVLVLCDVFDHSAVEAAAAVGTTEANVRVLIHRARIRLRRAQPQTRPLSQVEASMRAALAGLLDCMLRQDVEGMKALLAEPVVTVTDGGGEYTALHEPLVGRDAVVRFHLQTARRRGPVSQVEMIEINGLPALLIRTRPLRAKMAPRVILRCELDDAGRIVAIHSVLASRKLTAIRAAAAEPASPAPP